MVRGVEYQTKEFGNSSGGTLDLVKGYRYSGGAGMLIDKVTSCGLTSSMENLRRE